MIRSIKSNNPNFKTVTFHSGFNVILADRNHEQKNENKQTRNGAGKTTLIEIIHFCLGANVPSKCIFKNDILKDWSFILEIDIGSKTYSIERFTNCPSKIYINGDLSTLNFECKYDKKAKRHYVGPKAFNSAMLQEIYGIDASRENKYSSLSFRELISYVIRKNVEGYRSAFEFYSRQKSASIQLCNAFFLNLSIEYASQFHDLSEKKKLIDDYKKIAKTDTIGQFSLNIGELSTEVITRQNDVEILKKQLESFQIHPQYDEISKEANKLTDELHSLANIIILRQRLLEMYEESFSKETLDIPITDIETIYKEAGFIFQETSLHTLSEVIDFHKTIITNRKEYLQSEISSLKKEIAELKNKVSMLSSQRAEKMKILETHGALEEYILIQDRYAEAKQLLEDAKKRLKAAEYIEDSKSHLKIENQELLLKSRQDYNERISIREKAISIFKANTEFLYPEAGTLTIDLKETGYHFGIDIKNSRSQGVNYMKVFCYDMMLYELGSKKEKYPDFLVHDSTIFDGVDERQVSKALMLAYMKSLELEQQYICLINSDMVPYQEFDDDFKAIFDSSIVLKISDNQENGGLLGIRF